MSMRRMNHMICGIIIKNFRVITSLKRKKCISGGNVSKRSENIDLTKASKLFSNEKLKHHHEKFFETKWVLISLKM